MSTTSEVAEERNPAIPLCVPHIHPSAWTYIKDCLDSNWVSSVGSYVDRFEAMAAQRVAVRNAVATVNGTAALHTALLVAGVLPNDEVLVSSLTFIAPANAIRYANAWPAFIDAEPKYWQLDPERIAHFLSRQCVRKNGELRNRATGRRVHAILPVHVLGHPADMDPILELAKQYNLVVIEDATEGLGAIYKDRLVGSLGHISCLSFNGNKLITTGGGGMLLTNNDRWAQRARYLVTQAKDDPVEYLHNEIGYNYRLTNIQAALGCSQMENLDSHKSAKMRIARVYQEELSKIPGILSMPEAPWAKSVWWMYTILINEREYGCDSRQLLMHLAAYNIQSRPLWRPVPRNPAHAAAGSFECPVADRIVRSALSLPCSVSLTDHEQQKVIQCIRSVSCKLQSAA